MTDALTAPENPTILAFGCYLAFRHADRANDRGLLSAASADRASAFLNARVGRVWESLYPGKEATVYAWILPRFRMLVRMGVIPTDAAARVRQIVEERAGATTDPQEWGALASLWRVHVLYRFLLDQVDAGHLRRISLSRVKEGLHAQALAALGRAVWSQQVHGQGFLTAVLQGAATEVARLGSEGHLQAGECAILFEALGRPASAEAAPVAESVHFTGEGNCPVCAQGITAASVVYCGACETPQHAECWRYVGRCSMFACGCVDAVPAPGAPRPTPRFELDMPVSVPAVPTRGNPRGVSLETWMFLSVFAVVLAFLYLY